MLHNGVKQAEGCDERTGERVSHRDGKDAEEPGVVIAVFEGRLPAALAQRVTLGRRARHHQLEAVEEQLGEAHQFQRRPHQRRRDDVIHEKRPVVRQKDAAPATWRKGRVMCTWLMGGREAV